MLFSIRSRMPFSILFMGLLLGLAGPSVETAVAEPTEAQTKEPTSAELMAEFGYGVSVLPWTADGMPGFQWKKVYLPPSLRLPNHILYRMPVDAYDRLSPINFAQRVRRLTQRYGGNIEAYEIGNEVNLYHDGWEGFPKAEDYVDMLCIAYDEIKQGDPSAIVVSAGLAPVGRIIGNWGGYDGHNGEAQDEREYLRDFLAAGGAECADAIGYHPVGFRANFDVEPDVDGGTPETNCLNGFCFRGVEKIYEILVEHSYGDKKIWATEMGWLREPYYDFCLATSSWHGRGWQTVTAEEQAANLVGAFQYAEENWPWMGAIFIFNYNFNDGYYWRYFCEHMTFYSVKWTLAEHALIQMRLSRRVYMPIATNRGY